MKELVILPDRRGDPVLTAGLVVQTLHRKRRKVRGQGPRRARESRRGRCGPGQERGLCRATLLLSGTATALSSGTTSTKRPGPRSSNGSGARWSSGGVGKVASDAWSSSKAWAGLVWGGDLGRRPASW